MLPNSENSFDTRDTKAFDAKDGSTVISQLLFLLVGNRQDLMSEWPKELPPLPADIMHPWKALCEKGKPIRDAMIDKLHSLIHCLPGKTVDKDEFSKVHKELKKLLKAKRQDVKQASH